MKRIVVWQTLLLVLLLAACSAGGGADTDKQPVVRLMTHDSFDMSAELLADFEAETGIRVEVFKGGDGGEIVNKAVLSREAPLADVLYGIDNTFLSRALENDLFLPYDSPELANIAESLKLDSGNQALPVDFGDICLNYDVAWFAGRGLAPPDELTDLVDPAYSGLTVVQNPATSSPGLGFLLATIGTFGEDGYLDYWRELVGNDVLVTNDWETAYYSHFTAASDGDRPIVASYASSPVAEVYYAETPPDEPPTAAVTADGTCFRQIEFAGILRGTQVEKEARQLMDFLLGRRFQEDIPLKMFVYPANGTAVLPEVFQNYSRIPDVPVQFDPELIAANREAWIQAWTEVVLR